MDKLPPPAQHDEDIASYEVSEDGSVWRPYNPATDKQLTLHTRIQFVTLRAEDTRAGADDSDSRAAD